MLASLGFGCPGSSGLVGLDRSWLAGLGTRTSDRYPHPVTSATTPPKPKPAKLVFFVDANALLELYGALDPQVDDIPPKLVEVGDSLFLPRQIADEVERGKLRVAEESIRRVLAALKSPPPKLPVGLREHGKSLRSATEKLSATIALVKKSAADHLDVVAESRDGLSVALDPLLAGAVEASADVVVRARDRRERGNPPGKATGPLGDQLAWEQLLEQATDADILWLVTGDGDFATGTPKRLNPFLYRELRAVAPKVRLRLYGREPRDLAQALNEFFDEDGLADARFSDEQMAYFEHLADVADREREPWACFRDGANTPIAYANCVDCGEQHEHVEGEEHYVVRRVHHGYEVELLGGDEDSASEPEQCSACQSTTFEMEFEHLCSYCQHVWDGS